jgi:divinyl chlorophyllide a 8-vinyl-reductase
MTDYTATGASRARRVFVLGATGTIGKATVAALLEAGHEVVCLVRPGSDLSLLESRSESRLEVRTGQVTDPRSLRHDGLRGERFDVMVSCLASRSGSPSDAWALDHKAHLDALAAAREADVTHFVLLSAICVQKPRLAFQHAKLAFEAQLITSGLTYSVIRPTAYFKSLSGQFSRVRRGRPFLVFGNGRLTATKPVSDRDVGRFIARCIDDESLHNKILPVGGPGAAITPLQQAELLFGALGLAPRVRHVPVALLDLIVSMLSFGGVFSSRLRERAELARIGRYYATESMLVWNGEAGRYDADATPSTGEDTLEAFYRQLAAGEAAPDLGAHRVF